MAASAALPCGNWNYPTTIRFGANRVLELPAVCDELGIKRPLLVTDGALAGLPLVRDALAVNQQAGLPTAIFSDVRPNPVEANISDGVTAFRQQRCDGVIAFGGGSALDAGKAIALMTGQSRPLWDFEDRDDWYTRVDEQGMAPVVAIPTTSGTGSEVGRVSVILDPQEGRKKLIFHPRMMPARVICDPALTAGMPPALTAAVGMDALAHNLEAYCSPVFHPLADGIAVQGLRLIHRALPAAFAHGDDLLARSEMMAAATMGATAFQKGLGAMHAVGHPVGARFNTHHGLTLAVLMPYALVLNRAVIEDKLTDLSRYLGLPDPSFEAVLRWIVDLRALLGIPATLAELSVPDSAARELAREAAADPSAPTNPLPLNEDLLRGMIEQAIHGDLPPL